MKNPSTHSGQADKVVFGFWVYIMSDCVLFAGLFATYAVLGGAAFGSPGAAELFSLPFVFVETLFLLTSSFTAGVALLVATKATKVSAPGRSAESYKLLLLLLTTLLLGLAFLSMEVYEFHKLIVEGYGPSTNAFLSAFFTLVGTHGLHVLLGCVWLVVLMGHIVVRGLSAGTLRKLICFSLFWHFLDIIWIFIFTFVYIMGAL